MDDEFPEKVKTLLRFILAEEHGCKTAKDLEGTDGSLTPRLIKSGLASLIKTASVFDLLNMAYPGYLDGDYPKIRAHMIECGNKWKPDGDLPSEFMILSARRIFLEQEGVIKNSLYNREKILSTNWAEVFNQSPLRSVYNQGLADLTGPLNSLELAIPSVIGIRDGQIKPWDFKKLIQWSKRDRSCRPAIAEKYIKLLTQYIVRQAGCLDERDQPVIKKIKREKGWRSKFDQECLGALDHSGFTTWQAFQLTYPDLCGTQNHQLRESDFTISGNWTNETSVERFRRELAEIIYQLLQRLKESSTIQEYSAIFNPNQEFTKLIPPQEKYSSLKELRPLNIAQIKKTDFPNITFFVIPKDESDESLGKISFTADRLSGLSDEVKGKLSKLKLLAFDSMALQDRRDLNPYKLSYSDLKNPKSMRPLIIDARDMQQIKAFLLNHRILWDVVFAARSFLTAIKNVAGHSVGKAFEILLGEINPSSGCYGNTDIRPDMIMNAKTAVAKRMINSTQSLENFTLQNWSTWKEANYLEAFKKKLLPELIKFTKEKLRGVRLTKLLKSYKKIFKKKDDSRSSPLARILETRDEVTGREIFTERKLGVFLRLIQNVILDSTNLPKQVIPVMKRYIGDLYARGRRGQKSVGRIFLDALKFDPEAISRPTPLGVLNKLIGDFSSLAVLAG